MSEESKIDSDYVTMFDGAPAPAATPVIASVPGGLDDPNLSQVCASSSGLLIFYLSEIGI